MSATDTIYALSSGSLPAAIAIIRISGPQAGSALQQLVGSRPLPRRPVVATFRHPVTREAFDRGLVILFPGPGSATGEDIAELHLHGGRSVVAAALDALGAMEGLRQAHAGEFTRRSFENGRIDLAEAEGLADLLNAETDSQRRAALALAGGALSNLVDRWQSDILGLAAAVEAVLNFGDEGDVGEELPAQWRPRLTGLHAEMAEMLDRPSVDRLREGVRVVIAGPPNTGKSSLLNALIGREAAITSPIAGTTRDLVEAPAAIGGAPFLLVDTAGIRESGDEIETLGVGRARQSLALADIILWLGACDECPDRARSILVQSKADLHFESSSDVDIRVSAITGENIDQLLSLLMERAAGILPKEGEVSINARHRGAIEEARVALDEAAATDDLLIQAELLRGARASLDKVTGRAGVEDMLDSLFGRFCIGK